MLNNEQAATKQEIANTKVSICFLYPTNLYLTNYIKISRHNIGDKLKLQLKHLNILLLNHY